MLSDVPRPPQEGEVVVLRIYHATNAKKAVVKRDDDILTKEEILQHREEIEAAMLAELNTWAKFKCFSRKLRKNARNIIDSRWVLKWKYDTEEVSVEDARQGKQGNWGKLADDEQSCPSEQVGQVGQVGQMG